MFNPILISKAHLKEESTGGQIERIFVDNMPKEEFTPTVLCSAYGSQRLREKYKDRIIATKEYRFLKVIPALLRRIGLEGLTFLPDESHYMWGIPTKRYVRKNLDLSKFDYIHSISFPSSSHLLALDMKRRSSLPWIAHFYDPWHGNPHRTQLGNRLKEYDLSLERSVAENADFIIHVNYRMYDLWLERYGDIVKDKMCVMPLILNTNNPAKIKQAKGDNLIISHIGNFGHNRTSEVFITAVNNLFKEHSELKDKIKINYIGRVTDNEINLIKQFNLEANFNITGTISEEECISYYEQTDIFLAIDGKNSENIFFPSKIMKYFYYQKPIIGITPEDSVLTSELNRAKQTAIDNDNIAAITEYLQVAATDYDSLNNFDKNYWKRFSIEEVMKQYTEIVKGKLKKQPQRRV
ncbi:MAG: glycosyltransferase [Bacteroidaceae bacterium]|nr:glycosyltransferase [Bacteroidaceae bacterium]